MTILEAEEMRMPFGVHKGKTLAAIAAAEVDYFDYLLTIDGLGLFLSDAVKAVAEKHGRRRKTSGKFPGGANQLKLF